jgi:hypothetical protein
MPEDSKAGVDDAGQTASVTVLQLCLLIEGAALLIALVTPVTPSRTGSKTGLADLVITDPNYFEEVVVYFIITNILIGLIALVGWISVRVDMKRRSTGGDASG